MQNKTLIVGGGLVGSLWACILKKRGFDVEIFEKRPNPQNLEVPAGRSINLVITSRGIHGLKMAGLLEKILPITVPIYGRCIHPKTGATAFQPYGRDKSECNYSVSRWALNKALIKSCQDASIPFHFEHTAESIDPDKKKITFKTDKGLSIQSYERLFITDGAGSALRNSLLLKKPDLFSESIDWLTSDYKEIDLPAGPDGKAAIDVNSLHIWPRGTHMMMGLANPDNSFTLTLYLPRADLPYAFTQLKKESEVKNFFHEEFPDSLSYLKNYAPQFLENPQGKLATVRLNKWTLDDSIAFMGDAAHAIVPFFGQGMNLGFEDCTNMIKFYDESQGNWKAAFDIYDKSQRPNANAIADMALENFIEMRDKVGDKNFQFRKKIEALLEKHFPQYYRSRYGLITYTLVPYSVAQKVGIKQSEFLANLAENLENPEDLDLEDTKKKLETDFYPWMRSLGVETKSYKP